MRLKLAIFDFDGTLINSEPGIREAIELTVKALDLPLSAIEQWRQMVGIPLTVQLAHLLPPDRQHEVDASVGLYRQFYDQVGPQHSDPFPGIEALLEWLQPQMALAIASSKRRQTITRVLDQWCWQECFWPIISPTEVTQPKPHPESILQILAHHQVQPHQALMIGDTTYDMKMAQSAGVQAWGVSWGFHAAEDLWSAGANQVFSDPLDMLSHLQQDAEAPASVSSRADHPGSQT